MRKRVIHLALIMIGFASALSAQTIMWEKTYGDATENFISSVKIHPDGGYLLAGNTHFHTPRQRAWLIRTDDFGDTLWTKIFFETNGDTIYEVEITSNKDYILTGANGGPSGIPPFNVLLMRTDSLGSILFNKSYNMGDWDYANAVEQTSDGGFVLVGCTKCDDGESDIILIRTNAIGDTTWTHRYGKVSFEIGHDILQTSDNGFIFIAEGDSSLSGPYSKGILLIKTDEIGDTLWTKDWGYQGDRGLSLNKTIDAGYILGGYKDVELGWLIKTDSLGNTEWEMTYDGGELSSVEQTPNGGFVVAGGNRIIWTNSGGVSFLTMATKGFINSLQIIDNQSLIVAGRKEVEGSLDGWLAKIVIVPVPIITTDSVWIDIYGNGYADGTLDASNSIHPGGFLITGYEWSMNDSVLGTTAQIAASLPMGSNQVKLNVTDENGLSNSATKDIAVVVGELPAPVIVADDVWTDTDENGYDAGTLDGASSTHPAGFTIVDYKWRYRGTTIGTQSIINATLPTGTNKVYLILTDENGLIDSTSKDINVHAQLIQTEGPIASAVSSIGDSLFFSSSADDKVYFYDRSGNLRGTIRTGGAIRSTTTVGPNNIMYVGSSDTRLYAFDIDGNFIWDLPMGDVINSSPAVTPQDILYVGVINNRLFSLNGNNGDINWNFQTGGPINSSASISDSGIVYFGSDDGKLYALNPDGTLRWSYTTGGAVQSSPALDTLGNIYFGSDDGKLYSLSSSGTENWSYATIGEINSSPVIGADGTVQFGSADGNVYAVSSLGQSVWTYDAGSPVNGTGALAFNGILYIGTDSGKLLALSSTGELLWHYQTGAAVTAPPLITADNMIYFGSGDGAIYGMVDPNLLGLSKRALVETPDQWPTFQQNNQRTGQREIDIFGPVISAVFLANPIIGSYYDLYVFSDEALLAAPVVTLNDNPVEMTLETKIGEFIYHSAVHLTQTGQSMMTITAVDLIGNESEYESTFTFGKLVYSRNNSVTHNELGLTLTLPGSHLSSEGSLIITSLNLDENFESLRKVYPYISNSENPGIGEVFVIGMSAALADDYKLSYILKDGTDHAFYQMTNSGWNSLSTYTDESRKTVWTYADRTGIFGIFEGGEVITVPTEFSLSDAYPNPFNLRTNIRYVVPVEGDFKEDKSSKVSLNIYNIRGQLVKKLVNMEQSPGTHEAVWNGQNESGNVVSSGIYLMRLTVAHNLTTKKLTLLK